MNISLKRSSWNQFLNFKIFISNYFLSNSLSPISSFSFVWNFKNKNTYYCWQKVKCTTRKSFSTFLAQNILCYERIGGTFTVQIVLPDLARFIFSTLTRFPDRIHVPYCNRRTYVFWTTDTRVLKRQNKKKNPLPLRSTFD